MTSRVMPCGDTSFMRQLADAAMRSHSDACLSSEIRGADGGRSMLDALAAELRSQ